MKKNLPYLILALVLGCAAYFLWNSDKDGGHALSDFAIEDTSKVGRIRIDDGQGGIVDLKRGAGKFWTLNETYKAQPHQINLLLKTFIRAGVQSPVASSARENVMKIILGDNRKVEVFDREGTWIKTWYVGRSTQNNQGTFAILETPEDGLSEEPCIIEQRGFRGYLTTRFHAIIKDWRWTGIFYHPKLDIREVKMETPKRPANGFSINIPADRMEKMSMMDISGKDVPVSMIDISTYVEQFKGLYFESFESGLTEAQEDSVLALLPDCRVTVIDSNGKEESCDIYFKTAPEIFNGSTVTIDPERVYLFSNGDLGKGQTLTWSGVIKGKADFPVQ